MRPRNENKRVQCPVCKRPTRVKTVSPFNKADTSIRRVWKCLLCDIELRTIEIPLEDHEDLCARVDELVTEKAKVKAWLD